MIIKEYTEITHVKYVRFRNLVTAAINVSNVSPNPDPSTQDLRYPST